MLGRFGWSSLSDHIGRKQTYMIYFALGAVLYASVPSTGRAGQVVLFVAFYAIIMSMYGGGFATIPAYLRDAFGTMHVGAIHGRLLTAWSLAGVAGPVLVNYLREYQIAHGVAARDAYSVTMYVMAALLVGGFVANWFVGPGGAEVSGGAAGAGSVTRRLAGRKAGEGCHDGCQEARRGRVVRCKRAAVGRCRMEARRQLAGGRDSGGVGGGAGDREVDGAVSVTRR